MIPRGAPRLARTRQGVTLVSMLVPSSSTASPSGSGLHLFGMRFAPLASAAATGGALGLIEVWVPPGAGTPVHCHEHEEETLVVRSGAVRVHRLREAPRVLREGDVVTLARRVPHWFEGASETIAVVLIAFTPGGLEAALTGAAAAGPDEAVDPDDTAALLAGAGIALLG